jgi:hypothetical protein
MLNPHRTTAQIEDTLVHELQHLVQIREPLFQGKGTNPDWLIGKVEQRANQEAARALATGDRDTLEHLTRLQESIRKLTPDQVEKIFRNLYSREAGEVEARNAAFRRNMFPHERAVLPPWLTEDVLPRLQILVKK